VYVSDQDDPLLIMDQPRQAHADPTRCVFCARPVAATDRCPLLPTSHWECCACEAPEVAGTDAA
jgi:hypothetical protein